MINKLSEIVKEGILKETFKHFYQVSKINRFGFSPIVKECFKYIFDNNLYVYLTPYLITNFEHKIVDLKFYKLPMNLEDVGNFQLEQSLIVYLIYHTREKGFISPKMF